MNGVLHAMRAQLVALAIVLCVPGAVLGATAARVEFAFGEVSATGADGRSRALKKGAEVLVGETVITRTGRAQLRFADGAFMSLQPGTEFKIEAFHFSGGKGDAKDGVVMNLVKGGLRTVTGLVGSANPDGYKLKTEVATIGIRSTEYSVSYGNSISVHCADGSILVVNDAGALLLSAGQTGLVTALNAQPQRTDTPPFLSPRSGGAGGSETTGEKPSDPSNPVQTFNPLTGQQIVAQSGLTGTFAGIFAGVITGSPPGAIENVTLEGAGGGVLGFSDSILGPITIGSGGTVSVTGNDGIIAWGRWLNGTTTGMGPFGGQDLASTGPLHYAAGLPVPSMPTSGMATYNMIGATPPSCALGGTSPAVLSSSLVVDFGSPMATFHGSFSVDGNTVSTPGGGVAAPITGAKFFQSGSLVGGPYGTQLIFLNGVFAGDAAARAGVAYGLILDANSVNGAIVYSR